MLALTARPTRVGPGVTQEHWANPESRVKVLPVYMTPLISTDMLMLLLPLVLVRLAAESWRLSEAVGRRKATTENHGPSVR